LAVCETDELAHAAVAPGREAFRDIVRVFGDAMLDAEGRIDRPRLARRVFADASERAALNAIVHPRVREALAVWLRERARAGRRACAAIIPLLYEAGFDEGWDAVVCVAASEATQRARLSARGLTPEEARGRLEAQLPVWEKAARADYVIVNDGSEGLAEAQALRVLSNILERPICRGKGRVHTTE